MRVRLHDDGPGHQDFPWRTVIRSEMETWVPERLPARFRHRAPAQRAGGRRVPQPAWLPAALAAILVLVAALTYLRSPSPAVVPTVVQLLSGTAISQFAPLPPITTASVPANRDDPGGAAGPRSAPGRREASDTAPPGPQPVPRATAVPAPAIQPSATPCSPPGVPPTPPAIPVTPTPSPRRDPACRTRPPEVDQRSTSTSSLSTVTSYVSATYGPGTSSTG